MAKVKKYVKGVNTSKKVNVKVPLDKTPIKTQRTGCKS
jgi:hypothetical protein